MRAVCPSMPGSLRTNASRSQSWPEMELVLQILIDDPCLLIASVPEVRQPGFSDLEVGGQESNMSKLLLVFIHQNLSPTSRTS